MNPRPLLIAIVALAASLLRAQSPTDAIGGNLFPPDFIMANAEAINLTDEQKQALHDTVEKIQERFGVMQQALRQEADALGKLLAEAAPAEAAVLAQFDKVQEREGEIKRAQLALMLGIRARLTADQRVKLTELRAKYPRPQQPPEFAAKMERIKAGLAKWQSESRDAAAIVERMQQFQPLMQSGKTDQASALLDEAIKALEDAGK